MIQTLESPQAQVVEIKDVKSSTQTIFKPQITIPLVIIAADNCSCGELIKDCSYPNCRVGRGS